MSVVVCLPARHNDDIGLRKLSFVSMSILSFLNRKAGRRFSQKATSVIFSDDKRNLQVWMLRSSSLWLTLISWSAYLRELSTKLTFHYWKARLGSVPKQPNGGDALWFGSKGMQVWFVCGWQVKRCDPIVTHEPYLSSLETKSL